MNPAYLIWTDENNITHWLGRGYRPGFCPTVDAKLDAGGLASTDWDDLPAFPTCAFCVGSQPARYGVA